MKVEIPYYEDNTRISNSALGWYIKKGPQYLKDMLDGKEQGMSAKYLDTGTMIHMYILQPEEFWKNYVILDYEIPKVKQQLDFCLEYSRQLIVNPLEDDDKLLLDSYRSSYSNSKKDETVIEEAKQMKEKFKDYIESLKYKNENKTVISFADLTKLKTIKSNLDNHKKAKELLTDIGLTYNEFHINWEYDKLGISCKSLLDRVMFDHENKKIYLIDLKTTSNLSDFKHSVETYDYYRQIAFYILAITWYMEIDKDIRIDDYDLEAYIIAINSTGTNEIKVFNMLNEDVLLEKKTLIAKTLSDIKFHMDSGEWEHSKEYYEGDGTEKL